MADLERIYTVPLAKARYRPRIQRARGAVKVLKTFIARHMKADVEKVWLDNPVNEALWARGAKKPPRRIRVKAVKFDEDGIVEVSLPEAGAESRRVELAEAAEAHRASTKLPPKFTEEVEEGEDEEAKAEETEEPTTEEEAEEAPAAEGTPEESEEATEAAEETPEAEESEETGKKEE